MSMAYFVLVLNERFGRHNSISQHFIEAEDRQMVKYWYHFSQKEAGGFSPVGYDKHTIEMATDWRTSIEQIIEVTDPVEINVLREYLPHWH